MLRCSLCLLCSFKHTVAPFVLLKYIDFQLYLYSLGYPPFYNCDYFEPNIRYRLSQVIKLTQKIIKTQYVANIDMKQVALYSALYNTYSMKSHLKKIDNKTDHIIQYFFYMKKINTKM